MSCAFMVHMIEEASQYQVQIFRPGWCKKRIKKMHRFWLRWFIALNVSISLSLTSKISQSSFANSTSFELEVWGLIVSFGFSLPICGWPYLVWIELSITSSRESSLKYCMTSELGAMQMFLYAIVRWRAFPDLRHITWSSSAKTTLA